MIAKRIDAKPKNDNYGQLGKYIADASHEGEKLLFAWYAGCLSETYETALVEIEATQAMNTRCQGEKTYHLMVSFRPEDEAKLTPEAFQDIERAFSLALGFEEHQRLCGVHKNTNNMHMHVAYNMIHSERFTKKEPYRDFYKLSEACRAMEAKYGLVIDNGSSKGREPAQQINQAAASMEAHSGEQSFQSYALECKVDILKALESAQSWEDVHTAFAEYGMAIKPHANGLAVVSIHGKESIKASTIDRRLAKKRLVDRFGDYSASTASAIPEKKRYDRKPLQPKSPDRENLYEEYKKLMEQRQEQLDQGRRQNEETLLTVKSQWAEKRKDLEMRIMPRSTKNKLRQILRVQEQQALEEARVVGRSRIQAIKKAHPFHNWNGYLKWQAETGNETALAVLRSRKQETEATTRETPQKDAYYEDRQKIKMTALAKEKNIILASLSEKSKRGLLAINRMEQFAAQESLQRTSGMGDQAQLFSGVRHAIDNNGIVIFTMASGGTIRDTGKKLHFSVDETTRKAALIYGQARFGKNIQLEGNTIERRYGRRNQDENRSRRGIKPNLAVIGQIFKNSLRTLSQLDVVRTGKSTQVLLPGNARSDMER